MYSDKFLIDHLKFIIKNYFFYSDRKDKHDIDEYIQLYDEIEELI